VKIKRSKSHQDRSLATKTRTAFSNDFDNNLSTVSEGQISYAGYQTIRRAITHLFLLPSISLVASCISVQGYTWFRKKERASIKELRAHARPDLMDVSAHRPGTLTARDIRQGLVLEPYSKMHVGSSLTQDMKSKPDLAIKSA
jgi:hypothetical protein